MDSLIAEAEAFHRLEMPDRITVIAPRSWTDFHLQTPWQGGNAIGALTQIAEKHFDATEFLRHELPHAIVDQNMTLWRAHQMSWQPWLFEGLAVDFGRQKAYLSDDEFRFRARTASMAPVFDGRSVDMRFNYVAWRFFIEHLIHTRGWALFQDFLLRVMQDPDRSRTLLSGVFRPLSRGSRS